MCVKQNLSLASVALFCLRAIGSVYVFVAGLMIANNIHLAQAFGRGITAVGAFIFIASLWNWGSASLGVLGHRRHNKMILAVALASDLLLMTMLFILGTNLWGRTQSTFSVDLKQDCVRSVPETYTEAECLEYLRSDRYSSIGLAWRSYNALVYDDTKYYSRLIGLEEDGSCCGYGPPLRCEEDERGPPNYASTRKVSWGTSIRTECGTEDDWYAETPFCNQIISSSTIFVEMGGCKYEYPVGDCLEVEVGDSTKGCAPVMEDHLVAKINAHSLMVISLALLIVVSISSTCCMFWKRTSSDVLPDFVGKHIPWDPGIDKGWDLVNGPVEEEEEGDDKEGAAPCPSA